MSLKPGFLLFFIFTFGSGLVAHAENLNLAVPIQQADPNASTDQKLGTGFLVSGLEFLRKLMPEKYACASKIYAQTLNLEAYQSVYHMGKTNAGISGYFEGELSQNSCFAAVAEQFVDRIKAKDDAEGNSFGMFSNLQEVSGQGRYKAYPPGWAWQQALDMTNGDRNAAMILVGLCGHEESPAYSYEISGKNKVLLAQKDLETLEANLKEAQTNLKAVPASDSNERKAVEDYIRKIQSDMQQAKNSIENINTVEKRALYCPDNQSGFIAPKSLGQAIDIPDDLKQKVRRIQRPNNTNLDSLKSKYYHVTGSALMGCQMAKCGVSPEMAARVEEQMAGAYRAIRLCGLVKTDLKNLEDLSKKIKVKVDDKKFPEKGTAYLEAELKSLVAEGKEKAAQVQSLMDEGFRGKDVSARLKPRRCDSVSSEAEPLLSYLCKAAYLASSGIRSEEEARQEIGYLLREYDSALLYRKWYLGGGSALGVDIPCTDIRFRGPDNLEEEKPDCGMSGWSQQRCSTAVKKLATWDVDFDWTKKQHEVGSKFGASQCQKQNADEKLDKSFCKILKENSQKQSSGSAAGSSQKPSSEKSGKQ